MMLGCQCFRETLVHCSCVLFIPMSSLLHQQEQVMAPASEWTMQTISRRKTLIGLTNCSKIPHRLQWYTMQILRTTLNRPDHPPCHSGDQMPANSWHTAPGGHLLPSVRKFTRPSGLFYPQRIQYSH